MLRSTIFVVAMAYGLAACGDDCDGGGGGFFGSRSTERGAVAIPTMTTFVLVDANSTVVIELVVSSTGGMCASALAPQITRLVWDPARGTAVATTAVPSSSARRITGALLGGGVTTWEDVIPGLTIRASQSNGFDTILTFTSGTSTSTLTCSASSTVTCT